MSPSHHSSSSHSSHSSSHSHHSSSHSHSSSSSSRHSYSSHSSSYSRSGRSSLGSLFGGSSTRVVTPHYRERSNQPKHYIGVTPRIYRCKYHDYAHYPQPWIDSQTGVTYKAGYYDEDGKYYEDIVFSEHGKILDSATAVCRCDYCGMDDSRPWAEREKPCPYCGGNMSLVSQIDDLVSDDVEDEFGEPKTYGNGTDTNTGLSVLLVSIVAILLIALIGGTITNGYDEPDRDTFHNYNNYNIPDLGNNMFLMEGEGGFTITDESDYKDNYENGGYKYLVLDSDGNYYDKDTDMYVWLNEDIDPPQFQYWLEGLSSEYGDYGWMEYDPIEESWYIETYSENWEALDEATYEEFKDRLWHIDYEF